MIYIYQSTLGQRNQLLYKLSGNENVFTCPRCKTSIHVSQINPSLGCPGHYKDGPPCGNVFDVDVKDED